MKTSDLSSLRQALRRKLEGVESMLQPAFERDAVFPGMVESTRVRCGKPYCRCRHGERHPVTRLQIRFRDGIANRSLSEEEAALWRPRTEAYRRLREAMRQARRWQKEVLVLLEAIERRRRSVEGLSEEDQRRPLR